MTRCFQCKRIVVPSPYGNDHRPVWVIEHCEGHTRIIEEHLAFSESNIRMDLSRAEEEVERLKSIIEINAAQKRAHAAAVASAWAYRQMISQAERERLDELRNAVGAL